MDSIVFDSKIYSKDAILATCYWCADRIVAEIKEQDVGFIVRLKGCNGFVVDEHAIDEFKTMAIHNQLRYQLREKFASLETIIVEKAFRPVARS